MRGGGGGGWSSPGRDLMMRSVIITKNATTAPTANSGASNIGGVRIGGRRGRGESDDGRRARRGSGLTWTGGRDAAMDASGAAKPNMLASSPASSPGV